MNLDLLAANIVDALENVRSATGVEAIFSCIRMKKGDLPFAGMCNDVMVIGIGGTFADNLGALPESSRFAIHLARENAMGKLFFSACNKLGIQVNPKWDGNLARYLLQSYVDAGGTPVEVRLKFSNMRDFLNSGCLLVLGTTKDSLHAWLAWKRHGSISCEEKLRGACGRKMLVMSLAEIPINDTAFLLSHFRIASLLLEQGPMRIEDYFCRILRAEMSRELSSMVPVVDEQGSSDPSLRWRGDMIAVSYSEFSHLPFIPKDAARFAEFLARVCKVYASGDKKIIAKFGLPTDPNLAATQICVAGMRDAYAAIMDAPADFTRFPMGVGYLLISARLLKPYENPEIPIPAEGDCFIQENAAESYWRSHDVGKTVIRLTAGMLPFYPCKKQNQFFSPMTVNPQFFFNHMLSLQFGRHMDIVIPDKYGEDVAFHRMDKKGLAFLDSMRERISNFGYSYLCGKPFNGDNAFGVLLDNLEKRREKEPCLKKSA